MLKFIDIFFLVAHSTFMFFSLIGWAFKKTRRLNLYCLWATIFSWILLGYWYGLGYCFCTDWHWQIKIALGERELPNSYITYLINSLFFIRLNDNNVEFVTAVTFIMVLLISSYLNLKDYQQEKTTQKD